MAKVRISNDVGHRVIRPKKVARNTKAWESGSDWHRHYLSKDELIEIVKNTPGIIPKILGGKRRMVNELLMLAPKYIKEARIREFGILPLAIKDSTIAELKDYLSTSGIYDGNYRGVYMKPYAPYGVLTHEIEHAWQSRRKHKYNDEQSANIAGTVMRREMNVDPYQIPIQRITNRKNMFGLSRGYVYNEEGKMRKRIISKGRK